ncbi:MAG: hypothetical protein WB810_01570 [Candidatus Cybelea sp.]
MIVKVLANLSLHLRDLFVERRDDLADGVCNDGCLRRLCVHGLLRSSGLQMLVMAHQPLAVYGFLAPVESTPQELGSDRSDR